MVINNNSTNADGVLVDEFGNPVNVDPSFDETVEEFTFQSTADTDPVD